METTREVNLRKNGRSYERENEINFTVINKLHTQDKVKLVIWTIQKLRSYTQYPIQA